ncbi:hypothetical protein [Ottowia thiooxydans]|uniref:Uncharacterized protein n=1 Tax=Ottowia thiooxydans TaxID=219182 RepID=A0ABV2Q2Y7_9BURK
MSIGHRLGHNDRRPGGSHLSRYRAERYRRQRKRRLQQKPYRQGHGGWPVREGAFDECCIVWQTNAVTGDFLANAETLLTVRLERESLDDIAPTQNTRRLPCTEEPC